MVSNFHEGNLALWRTLFFKYYGGYFCISNMLWLTPKLNCLQSSALGLPALSLDLELDCMFSFRVGQSEQNCNFSTNGNLSVLHCTSFQYLAPAWPLLLWSRIYKPNDRDTQATTQTDTQSFLFKFLHHFLNVSEISSKKEWHFVVSRNLLYLEN